MTAPSAAAVANWFLDKASDDGYSLDQLQLQKLVYYANGWYLANRDEELFSDDVLAWPHGPLIKSLWTQFREAGRSPIKERAREVQLSPGERLLDAKFSIPRLTDPDRIEVCEKVWQQYGRGRFTGVQLSNMTHAKDEPWEVVRRFCRDDERPVISSSVIRDAFKLKLAAAKAAA
jgi:uncharacterized phage-associated protein